MKRKLLAVIILCVVALAVYRGHIKTVRHVISAVAPAAYPDRTEAVARVVDGDTIVLDRGERVRFFGIDTPELHHPTKPIQCFAREAKNMLNPKFLGKKVKLTFESPLQDQYGRTLAWIWYGKNFERLLNADIVAAGYGFSFRRYPTSRLQELNRLEAEARKIKRGLWAPTACNGKVE